MGDLAITGQGRCGTPKRRVLWQMWVAAMRVVRFSLDGDSPYPERGSGYQMVVRSSLPQRGTVVGRRRAAL